MSLSERTPLLEDSDRPPSRLRSCYTKYFPNGYWQEFVDIVKLATPIMLSELTNFMIGPVAIMFCGRLGKAQLDGVAMANSMINVTGMSIAVGLSTACDTLFSQIYGSPHKINMGIALQRSLIIITMFAFPCWAIHLNIENILLALGQDPEVARLTGEYLLIFLPGILAYFIFICLMKYLMSQNIVYPILVVGLISNIINVILHYVLVFVLDYGLQGSAVAQLVTYISFLVLTILYIVISKVYKETWPGWKLECLMEWGIFFRLAGYGVALVCVEWWSFEIGIFLSGIMGTTELGAQSVIFQLECLSYMIPLGVGTSAGIRVGQFLGAQSRDGAVTSASVAITSIALVGLSTGALLIGLREYLPRIFTNVEDVVSLASTILPILGIFMLFDTIGAVCNGVLRGCGRQNLGAAIATISYGMGLSIGIPLMFLTDLKTAGYWWGLAIGISFESIIFAIIILRTDWDGQVDMARERTQKSKPVSGLSRSLSTGPISGLSRSLSRGYVPPDLDPSSGLSRGVSTGHVPPGRDPDNEETTVAVTYQTLPRSVIIRTLVVIIVMFSTLVLGILCRILIPVNTPMVEIPQNSTYIYNQTLL